MSASSLWNVTELDFPAEGSPRQKLEFALKYAALAPTEDDWPRCKFRVEDSHLELIAEADPQMEAADPDGREMIISCGAALLYLNLALKHFGCLGRVALFPDLGEPALVARIHVGFCGERDPMEAQLYTAMTGRRTQGLPPSEPSVFATTLAALGQVASGDRSWLDFAQSETSRQQILEVTMSGNHPANVSRARLVFDGGSVAGKLPVGPTAVPAATLAVVKTKTDDKRGWLEAGQTLARTILQAQALGLSWTFFNPVRRRTAREALRVGVGHKGFAQVILQLGSRVADEIVQLTKPTTSSASSQ